MEVRFQKLDLQHSAHIKMIAVQFVGPSPWCGIVARPKVFINRCSGLMLDSSWPGDMVTWLVEYRLSKKKLLDQIHAKLGDRHLCILGGLSTIEIYKDYRLVSQDFYSCWVVEGISEKVTEITTWQGDLVLYWFDSQVYGLFLFHLIAWWFRTS